MRMLHRVILLIILTIGWCANAHADGIDSGDTAWLLTSTALVLFMTLPRASAFLWWTSP